jgi:hypothetical protein
LLDETLLDVGMLREAICHIHGDMRLALRATKT